MRAAELIFRNEMRDLGHHLLGEELHRSMPDLGVSAVIETEEEKGAEAADFGVHPLDLFDDRCWRADQPIMSSAIFRCNIAIGDIGIVLQELDYLDSGRQRR